MNHQGLPVFGIITAILCHDENIWFCYQLLDTVDYDAAMRAYKTFKLEKKYDLCKLHDLYCATILIHCKMGDNSIFINLNSSYFLYCLLTNLKEMCELFIKYKG